MKVRSKQEAWSKADVIFPTDYIKDDARSESAGYDIYYSTAEGVHAWISDLGDRLEVNLATGGTVNIWIEEEPKFKEYQIADALKVVNDAIYSIDDEVNSKLAEVTGIKEARAKLYGAYSKIARILKEQYPDSKLYNQYNLQYAEQSPAERKMKIYIKNLYGINDGRKRYYRKVGDGCFDFGSKERASDLTRDEVEKIMQHAEWYKTQYKASEIGVE